jgi:putative tryptophan/tyrosine transport system substrate-binding protein
MRRRTFLGLVGAAAASPLAARAQQAKIPRVGLVWIGSPEHESQGVVGLKKGLAELGYVFGRDLIFDERYAYGRADQIPTLIAALLATGVDVLVTPGNGVAAAAHRATTTIPIVYLGDDLVGAGLVASLARPGGNVTGVDVQSNDYRAKWVELLKAVAPKLRSVAVLWDPDENLAVLKMKEAESRFGLTLTFLSARRQELDTSLTTIAATGFDGLIVNDNTLLVSLLPRVIAAVAENRTPTIYGFGYAARQGGLMGYSPNFFELGRRLASYVDKILKGAHAGELPIEQPTAFNLAINLKTAKALGLEIPPTLLAAADEVIE